MLHPFYEDEFTMHSDQSGETGVSVSAADGINIIRFDRASKKNAITGEMYERLSSALSAAEADTAIRVHVILGSPGVFSAGNDIQDFIDHGLKQGGLGAEVLEFLRTLVMLEKPIVAGVDGLAIGIGATMLLHCDIVYASESSFLQTPFVDLGLVPEAASSLIVPGLMGYQRAFGMLALGERLSAEDAWRGGLVSKVLDSSELESETLDVAARLAKKPPEALATTRKLIRGERGDILKRIEEEAVHFSHHLASDAAQQAFARFMNKT